MSIKLEYKNPCIASFDFDGSKIFDLVNKNRDTMITHSAESYGFNFDNEVLRSQLNWDVEHYRETMDPLQNYLTSIKEEAIKTLIENSSSHEWPKDSVSNIAKELYLYTTPYVYKKGFFMQSHRDNRLSVAAGCLNLDDNDDVTFFTGERYGKEIFRCSGKKNKGYIWLNTDDGYHSVDLITKERTVVIFNFVFALF